MRERDFIEWIRAQRECEPSTVPVGPGDDCAIVFVGGERLLVSVDQLIDGVHFRLADCGAESVGRKAMSRALSDLAAMAASPLAAVGSVALPKGFSQADAEALHRGRRGVSDQFACPMVGGDVAVHDGPLMLSITVFGRDEGIEPVLRSGAQPGDALCVTGRLGASWRAGRDMTFRPRIAEARALAERFDLHAMIDLSDGLSLDARRLCEASAVGAIIRAADVPIHPDATRLCPDNPLASALHDGEDYELLFALPVEHADALVAAPPSEVALTKIGEVIEGSGVLLEDAAGQRSELRAGGWQYET